MKVIYKQQITDAHVAFNVAASFKPLSVHIQRGIPCLWYETDDEQPLTGVAAVYLVGTGTSDLRLVPPDGKFIGTFMSASEDLVFHAYVAARFVQREGDHVRAIQM